MITVERSAGVGPLLPLARCAVASFAAQALTMAGRPDAELSIVLVSDQAIADLNSAYLGCSGPTNVLSFPADEKASHELGEVALSVETCLREAFLYGQPPYEHAARLLAHGLLHLAGFDHGAHMEDLTEDIVEELAWVLSPGSVRTPGPELVVDMSEDAFDGGM